MKLSDFKRISIGGTEVKQLTLDGTLIWKAGITNRIPLSINADGSIYNGGLGYKTGYRVRSGGGETAQARTSCSGFIAVQPGDVIRITNCSFDEQGNSNAINAADADFNNIGQWTMLPAKYGIFLEDYVDYAYASVVQEREGVWRWVVPPAASGVRYIRLTCYDAAFPAGPTDMVLTINEEID